MEKSIQKKLDDFYQPSNNDEYDQREALRRITQNHVNKMADILNQIFERLFNEPYIREV